jgi:hypothetical protein
VATLGTMRGVTVGGATLGWAALALAALALAPAGRSGGPAMQLGATEDAVRSPTLTGAKAQMDLLRLAGFRAVRISQVWAPGETEPSPADRTILRNVAQAAKLDGIDVLCTVMHFGSRTTPLTDDQQASFAAYAAAVAREVPHLRRFVVANEPNLNRYWLPQFNEDGSDAAAVAYERLLARTYDALKAVSPSIEVVGGAVSPRGGDVPGTGRDTHSPTVFIRDLGAAYRASGRTKPLMDAFAFHPYEDNSSVAPVDGTHPSTTTIALADYDKLVGLLGEAFDGTPQRGSTLPVVYDEFGVESLIPAAKQKLYTGTEPATTKPVDEATQALFYAQAIQLAFCQPNVEGLFLFHTRDEVALAAWQSGLYYADDTPKSSLAPVRDALEQARRGVVARCPGLKLMPRPTVSWRGIAPTLTCDIDCAYTAKLLRLPATRVATLRGRAIGARPERLAFPRPRPGRYRVELWVVAPLNPGPVVFRRGPAVKAS